MANKLQIFDRLAGLETEYALRFHSVDLDAPVPPKYVLFRALLGALRRRLLTVEARHFKDGVFTATGGALWFETERPLHDTGLVEGSTPECRGPRQLLLYQRAQDTLLAQAAASASLAGELSLLKNDQDAEGNVYGAQENYEAVIASGWRLWAWRAGLTALAPVVLLTWLGFLLLILMTLAYIGLAQLCYLPLASLDRSRRWATMLFGRDVANGTDTGALCPPWLAAVLNAATRVLTAPLALGLLLVSRAFAFRRLRAALTPFLVSRTIIAGAGHLDADGRFHLADKAGAMTHVVGCGGFWGDRPIFTFLHFLKSIIVDACFSPHDFFDLWRERQRLQIALGDSNMADVAEYLRIGTTMLVLDCIEAGQMPPVPRLARPMRALRAIIADPSLEGQVRLKSGRAVTALELQRFYWQACRRYVEATPDAPAEARTVLRLWHDVLDRLEHEPLSLVGKLDWVTKRYLLLKAGRKLDPASRKKLDLRYHELSDAGYFMRLKHDGRVQLLLEEADIDRASRTPPADTPATTRGHYIREFGGGSDPVSANWKYVFLGRGSRARTIRVADFGRTGVPASKRRRRRTGRDAAS